MVSSFQGQYVFLTCLGSSSVVFIDLGRKSFLTCIYSTIYLKDFHVTTNEIVNAL